VLTDGLLRSNASAVDAATLENLMRAAHSIKGAAAIVGLEPAVALAHAMEDLFVAAQHGKLALGANDVDALLGAVDLMLRSWPTDDPAAGAAVASAGWRRWHGCGKRKPAVPPRRLRPDRRLPKPPPRPLRPRRRRLPPATSCWPWPARRACTPASCVPGSRPCSATSASSARCWAAWNSCRKRWH
jgi:two-component system sensor histidine kinase and response regulator WspE